MTCFTYAKQEWTSTLDLEWKAPNGVPDGPHLYDEWTGSTSTALSSRKVPCVVIYTGGDNGHTAIITEYADGKYHYKDYNGKKTNDYDDRWLDSDGVVKLFNTRTFKGICY